MISVGANSISSIWNCPKTGLWTVTCNIFDTSQRADHLVIGNVTRNEPIVTNGSSATVFISSTNRINTCGYFGGSFDIGSNVGDNHTSYISFRLLLPVTITT